MNDSTKQLVADLKKIRGRNELAADDFYESEEVAEFEIEKMFQYFRGELDSPDKETVLRLVNESNLFLDNLIGVGEIVLWIQIRNAIFS